MSNQNNLHKTWCIQNNVAKTNKKAFTMILLVTSNIISTESKPHIWPKHCDARQIICSIQFNIQYSNIIKNDSPQGFMMLL